MPQRAQTPSWFVLTLMALCVGLVAVEFGLVRENRKLAAELTALRQAADSENDAALRSLEGQVFPVLDYLDEGGHSIRLTDVHETHATLLFISTPTCDYCRLAEPVWDRVQRRLQGTPVRAFGLLLDGQALPLEPRTDAYPSLSAGDRGPELLRTLPGVPVAVLLDASGVVQHATYGGNQLGLEEAIERFLAGGRADGAR